MTWRVILIPVVVAAIGGVFITAQLKTRTIDLDANQVSPSTAGAFIEQARAEAPELHAADDMQLMRLGLSLCAAVKQVPKRVVVPRPVGGLTAAELYAVTDAATRHLCPTQRPKVAGYLRGTR